MAEFGMTESHVVISSVGVQGPKGYSGIEAGPNPPSDTNVLWADTDDNFAVVAGSPISGTGFPEGAVAAPVGQRYIDVAATNGAVEWIKVSGSGSTGWKVAYGDTGRRDVTSLIAEGWSHKDNGGTISRRATLRRQGNMVTFTCLLDSGTYSGAVTDSREVINLPNGFKNTEYAPIGIGGAANNNVLAAFATTGTIGRVYVRGYGTGMWTGYLTAEFTYRTGDPWPTTLPGVAV